MHLLLFVFIGFIPWLGAATHCWYCGPVHNQDDCDKELHYLQCDTHGEAICVALKGLNQLHFERFCIWKYDYEWNLKEQCERGEYGHSKGLFCEVASCPGDCIATVDKGGPFKCPACAAKSEDECNKRVYMNVCPEGFNRCLKTRYFRGGVLSHVVRNCGDEAIFEQEKIKCADGSCEVSVCNESHCVA